MKQFVRQLMDRFGIETNRSTTLRRFLSLHPIDLVVDAGANLVQFAQLVQEKGYRGRVSLFEHVT